MVRNIRAILYENNSDTNIDKKIIGPIYPEKYLRNITTNCIRNLIKFCESEQINAVDNTMEAKQLYWSNWLISWSETWLPI